MTFGETNKWAVLPEPKPTARPIVMAYPVIGLPKKRASKVSEGYADEFGGTPPVLCLGLYPGHNDLKSLKELYPMSWTLLWDTVELSEELPLFFHILTDSEVIWIMNAEVHWYSTRKRFGLGDAGCVAYPLIYRSGNETVTELHKSQYPKSYGLMSNEDAIPIKPESVISYASVKTDRELETFLLSHPMSVEEEEFWNLDLDYPQMSEKRSPTELNIKEIRDEIRLPSNRRKYWEIWLSPCPNRLIVYFKRKMIWQEGMVCLCVGQDSMPTVSDIHKQFRRAVVGSWYYALFDEPMFNVRFKNGRKEMIFLPPREIYR